MRTIGTGLTVAAVASVTTAAGIAIAEPDPRVAIAAPITIETVVGRGTDTSVDNGRKGEGVGDSFRHHEGEDLRSEHPIQSGQRGHPRHDRFA